MKTISLAVSEDVYDSFRQAADREGRSIAHMIRDAMAFYLETRIGARTRLTEVPVLLGHRPLSELPSRGDIWEEIFADPGTGGE